MALQSAPTVRPKTKSDCDTVRCSVEGLEPATLLLTEAEAKGCWADPPGVHPKEISGGWASRWVG